MLAILNWFNISVILSLWFLFHGFPKTKWAFLCCTISNCLIYFWWCGSHTGEQFIGLQNFRTCSSKSDNESSWDKWDISWRIVRIKIQSIMWSPTFPVKIPIHPQWASGLTTAALNILYGQPTWLLCSIMYRAVHIFTDLFNWQRQFDCVWLSRKFKWMWTYYSYIHSYNNNNKLCNVASYLPW